MTRAYCATIAIRARLVYWGIWEKSGGEPTCFSLWQLWCWFVCISLPAVPSRMPKQRTFSAATSRVGFDTVPKCIPLSRSLLCCSVGVFSFLSFDESVFVTSVYILMLKKWKQVGKGIPRNQKIRMVSHELAFQEYKILLFQRWLLLL